MKKLIILTVALLLGVGSVLAQGPWEVLVTWSYHHPYDCLNTNVPSTDYGMAITLDIYDVANNAQITNPNPVNTVGLYETETLFSSAQAQVETYCEKSLNNTPSFKVTVTVAIVKFSPQEVYCYTTGSTLVNSCNLFSNGVAVQANFY